MSEISTSLALCEEYSKLSTIQGQQMKHMVLAPSKSSRNEEGDKASLFASFNQKAVIIQFLLFAAIFELMNSLSMSDSVVKIIEFTCQNIKGMSSSQKPLNWITYKKEFESFYQEILKASDHLIIKEQYSTNVRSIQFLKQAFKVFVPERPPQKEKGDPAKLLGEAIIQYLFAYTFLKRIGKTFEHQKSGLKHDAEQLSIERIYESINLFKKCNKKAFLIFLSKFRLNDQLLILDEVKEFLQVNF